MTKEYTYIFVRQDISIEQQMVQVGHVCMKMGYYLPLADPDKTHFVLVGVRNEEALEAIKDILEAFDYEYSMFTETYPKPHKTAIATYPVKEHDKGVLKAFNLLKVNH